MERSSQQIITAGSTPHRSAIKYYSGGLCRVMSHWACGCAIRMLGGCDVRWLLLQTRPLSPTWNPWWDWWNPISTTGKHRRIQDVYKYRFRLLFIVWTDYFGYGNSKTFLCVGLDTTTGIGLWAQGSSGSHFNIEYVYQWPNGKLILT